LKITKGSVKEMLEKNATTGVEKKRVELVGSPQKKKVVKDSGNGRE